MGDVQRLVSARSCSEKRCLLWYRERCTCPTENQSMPWGESIDTVLSSFSPALGKQSGSCWLRNIQLVQLLLFQIVKHPLLTEGTDSKGRLLNACTQSADLPFFFPSHCKRNVSKFVICAFDNYCWSWMSATQQYVQNKQILCRNKLSPFV